MTNTNIPLQVNSVDTATPIQQMGQSQNNNAMAAEQLLQQHYQSLDAREKSRLSSTIVGAVQLKSFLDNNDTEGAQEFLQRRRSALHRRMGEGENIDTQETDAAIEMLRGGRTDELKQGINGLVAAGQVYGILNPANTAGGDTGVLVDRLIKEGSAKNVQEALQQIKGGAGQTGRNLADIGTGYDANYQTQGGKNASDVETAGPKATAMAQGTAMGAADADAKKKIQDTQVALGTFEALKTASVGAPSGIFEDIGATLANKSGTGGAAARAQGDFAVRRGAAENAARAMFRVVGSGADTERDAKPIIDMLPSEGDEAGVKETKINAAMQELRNRVGILAQQRGLPDPFADGGTAGAGTGNKINLVNPQTGETAIIDPSDLQAAMAEGFVQQ